MSESLNFLVNACDGFVPCEQPVEFRLKLSAATGDTFSTTEHPIHPDEIVDNWSDEGVSW